jgi:uncharacterized protein YggU (UPF0235/DUF167 family)
MYIKIKVIPSSKREVIDKIDEENYEIKVKQEPKNNAVNKRLVEIMRDKYKNAKIIRIISGHRSPSKIISIDV